MKSVGSWGSLSLLFMMTVLVWCLWVTLTRLWTHSLSCYLQGVVVVYSLQFHRYLLWLSSYTGAQGLTQVLCGVLYLSLFLFFVLHRLLQFFSSFLWSGQPATSYRPSVCANNSPVTSEFCISVGSWSWNNSNTKHWGCSSCAGSELNASARVGHCTCFSTSQCCSEDASKSTPSCWPEEACWAYASSFTTSQVSFGWNPKLSTSSWGSHFCRFFARACLATCIPCGHWLITYPAQELHECSLQCFRCVFH